MFDESNTRPLFVAKCVYYSVLAFHAANAVASAFHWLFGVHNAFIVNVDAGPQLIKVLQELARNIRKC